MCKILVRTTDLSHEEWLNFRRQGIGGSDAGAICGLNPYSSPISVYYDKTNQGVENIDNEAMRQGRDLEDYVADRFKEATGYKLRRVNAIYYNEKHPHLLANVDRMIVGEEIGLECKTTNILNANKWENGEVPAHYQIQCHHYMAVTGAKAWYIAVVILGKEFKFVRIDRDEEIINNLISIENEFWNNYVLDNQIPSPDGSKVADEIINKYFKIAKYERIVLQDYEEKLKRRAELITLLDKLEKEKKIIEQEVKIAMADAEIANCEGFEIQWKNVLTNRLDTEKIKLNYPEIYKDNLKETISRRFTVKSVA